LSLIYDIQNINKSFGKPSDKFHALNGVSLQISKGDCYGIIGLSGAGKSTLIRCMNMLEQPTSGSILFDNSQSDDTDDNTAQNNLIDITKLNYSQLSPIRKNIGMIFQSFNLLNQRTVLKNIYLPLQISHSLTASNKAYAEQLLQLVDLQDKKKAYPSTLSGGQKQRVAIARALVTRPKVLLCDEPTSALDPETTKGILKLLKDINTKFGITIVIITHEMSVVERLCNKVTILDKGSVVEQGAVGQIFANPQTQIAKDLVQKESDAPALQEGMARIIFDGNVDAPVVSSLSLQLGIPISIFFAQTKEIDGKTYGQMIVKLPNDNQDRQRAIEFFASNNIIVETNIN